MCARAGSTKHVWRNIDVELQHLESKLLDKLGVLILPPCSKMSTTTGLADHWSIRTSIGLMHVCMQRPPHTVAKSGMSQSNEIVLYSAMQDLSAVRTWSLHRSSLMAVS